VPYSTVGWTLNTELEWSDTLIELAKVGAAWRIAVGRELARTDTSSATGEPRRAEEVPPGHPAAAAGELRQMRTLLLNEEHMRLRAAYPYRML
jgi:hypothetical protein